MRARGLLAGAGLLGLVAGEAVRSVRVAGELHQAQDQARRDELTGLLNRAGMGRSVAKAVEREGQAALLLVDLDGFKAVNDSLGHQAGDDLLVEVATRIRSMVGNDSLVGRLGGDEFLVVGGSIPDPDSLASRINAAVRQPVVLEGTKSSVSCSIGWAVGRPGMDPVDLFRLVDRDLYRIKRSRPGQRWASG